MKVFACRLDSGPNKRAQEKLSVENRNKGMQFTNCCCCCCCRDAMLVLLLVLQLVLLWLLLLPLPLLVLLPWQELEKTAAIELMQQIDHKSPSG